VSLSYIIFCWRYTTAITASRSLSQRGNYSYDGKISNEQISAKVGGLLV